MTHPAAPVLDPPVQSAMSSADLIAHILERYHAVHLAELGDLIPLARKVEAVHAGHPAAPAGLADHLSFILDDLCGHQRKEEQVLFPMMLDGSHPMIAHPIARMIAEHQDVEEQLSALAKLTAGFSAPTDACGSWRALIEGCRKLNADLREHMRLENQDLFPRFA
jgi:regulator of cell morphogenesis and NO signaling